MIRIDMQKLREQVTVASVNLPPESCSELLHLAESVLQADDDGPGEVIRCRSDTVYASMKDIKLCKTCAAKHGFSVSHTCPSCGESQPPVV